MGDAPREESIWRGRARRLLFWAIVLELVGVAFFVLIALREESSRLSLLVVYAPPQPLLVATVLGAILSPFTKKRVKTLVIANLAATAVALFFVMGLRLGSARPSEWPLRLATYNVYFGHLGRPALLDEVVAMVNQNDIVVCQAAYDTMSDDIKPRVGDRFVHQDDEFLIVSKFKIVDVELPPPLPDTKRTMYVGYLLETDRGPLRVVSVHPFSPRHALVEGDHPEINIWRRNEQIARAMAAAHRTGAPFVIVGDTNLPPLSAMSRKHLGDLHDAFDDVGFGFGYTFPAKHPWMRIDRALAGEGIRFDSARVGPRGKSDHLPLFVELAFQYGH